MDLHGLRNEVVALCQLHRAKVFVEVFVYLPALNAEDWFLDTLLLQETVGHSQGIILLSVNQRIVKDNICTKMSCVAQEVFKHFIRISPRKDNLVVIPKPPFVVVQIAVIIRGHLQSHIAVQQIVVGNACLVRNGTIYIAFDGATTILILLLRADGCREVTRMGLFGDDGLAPHFTLEVLMSGPNLNLISRRAGVLALVVVVVSKIAELYEGYVNGTGSYPLIKSVDDRMKVKFSSTESYLYTPFYSLESGTWKNQAACETLVEKMVVRESNKITHLDPRFYYYFTRTKGIPTQLSPADLKKFMENNTVGYFASGGTYGNLQNGEWYPVLNYSEILFNFAEAAYRGWLPVETKQIKELYLDACEASMKEWNPNDKVPTSPGTTIAKYRTYLDEEFDAAKALEMILTQKWISTFWLGIESWADYRRTGYPILKTNGSNAQNNGILCTRMRYPATEAYLNKGHYESAISGWLGGDNNMTTDVWWADTEDSRNTRRLGRQ